jgi:hypothetical protein
MSMGETVSELRPQTGIFVIHRCYMSIQSNCGMMNEELEEKILSQWDFVRYKSHMD